MHPLQQLYCWTDYSRKYPLHLYLLIDPIPVTELMTQSEKAPPKQNEFSVEVIGQIDQIEAIAIANRTADKLMADGVDLTHNIMVIDANTREVFAKKFVQVIGEMDYQVASDIAYTAAKELTDAGEDLSRKIMVVNASTSEVYPEEMKVTTVTKF